MKVIRIFISSPSDVAEERDRARQVVEQLRHRYAGQFELKAVLWEDLPLQADMSFQQGIDMVLSRERGIDIAIFILWSRLGSPLGALIHKPDGSSYRSGTEREFDLVMAARHQSGGDVPKILVYTRRDEVSFDERLRGKPTEEKTALLAQKRLVEAFIQEEFHDASSGANVRAYHSFDHPVTFSQRLRAHLQEILDPLAGDFAGDPVWEIDKQGSPFRGLEAFEFVHSAVFFGREDEALEVRRALQRKAQEGCAFVLISGASGSGKSSLARAGVLPAIIEHEVDSTVAGWRYAVCTPSQLGENMCAGLARVLCGEAVLPELGIAPDSVRVLAEGFAQAPKPTVDQSVRPALMRAAQGKAGAIRLFLLVDQLEELFVDKRLKDDDRERFTAALEALARSGSVWVLGTVRSDFYQHCQRLPALIRMKEGAGQVDLLPPTSDALGRLIVHPARLARLTFERRDGASLEDRILSDATSHAELLPLLSYLLRELFEQRTPAGVLTFASYEQLGGVEGALAKRAETVFAALPGAAQLELTQVLRALVSVGGDEEESVVRQRVPLTAFPPETPARVLVDRFVAERFLVTEAGAGGTGTVAVAHEALLRVWNRAAQWIADNRDFLRVRARVAARMKEGSRLLEGDPLLELARHHLATTGAGFTGEQTAFIEDCARTAQEGRRHREHVRKGVIAVLAALALFAILAAGIAAKQRQVAVTQSQIAKEQQRIAQDKSQEAVKQGGIAEAGARRAEAAATEARMALAASDFSEATRLIEADDSPGAVAYLCRILSVDRGNSPALTRLTSLLTYHSWVKPPLVLQHEHYVQSALFSPDGKHIVTVSGTTTRVWDAQTGQALTEPLEHGGWVVSAQFSPDGKRIVTAFFGPSSTVPGSMDGTVEVRDAQTGMPLTEPIKLDDQVVSAQFSPDGKRIVTASGTTARVWDAQKGQPLTKPLTHANRVWSARFGPDGKRIVTASGTTAQVWDAETGQWLTNSLEHGDEVCFAQFSPDGKFFVTASWDKTARVWDAQTGEPRTKPLKHGEAVYSAQFSPDGKRIVTASGDNTARVWDAQKGEPRTGPLKHGSEVTSAQFSPDGRRIVTASQDHAARVWDAQTGQPLTDPLKHGEAVNSAQFSPDGRRIVTASQDASARVWDIQSGQPLTEALTQDGQMLCAQFSTDGNRIVTASQDHTARVWDAHTGEPQTGPLKHGDEVISAHFSPDGKRIVTASWDHSARVWEVQTGKLLTMLKHDNWLCSAQFSPDGEHIVTASRDSTARVWDAKTGAPRTDPLKHSMGVNSAEFSPDGKRIVTASKDRTAQVWNVQTGEPLTEDRLTHDAEVVSAQFSPDGKRIVTASQDGTARVWDALSCRPLSKPLKHGGPVNFAQYSPDGKRIVTASKDNTARVWDAATGELVTKPLKHGGPVIFAQFSPDGKRVVTASKDKTAQVWEAQTGQPLAEPFRHEAAVKSAQFSPDGKRILTACEDGTARVWDLELGPSRCPDWLLQLAEALSDDRLNDMGILEETSLNCAETIAQLRQYLNNQPDTGDGVIWGRWLLADRSNRTISPLSSLTVPAYIERRINQSTAESLDEAEQLAAGNEELSRQVVEVRALFERTNGPAALQSRAKALADQRKLAEREANCWDALQSFNPGTRTEQVARLGSWINVLIDVLMREGKFDDADQVFRDMLTPDVVSQPESAALLRERGTFFARRGRWKDAAADLYRAVEFDPADHWLHHLLTPLLVQSDDLEGYRRHCAQVLARFGGTNDPVVAERMAKDCLILPDAGVDLVAVAQWADTAVTKGKDQGYFLYFEFAEGLAEYRQGHFVSAVASMKKILRDSSVDWLNAQAYLVLAMAQHQSGQQNDSRDTLDKGADIVETKLPKLESGDIGVSWNDWIIVQALLHEAKALIERPEGPGH
jgi:pentatricopeptide repeat protein